MRELKKRKGFIPKIDRQVTDAIENKWLNVAYAGESPDQVLDIYYPNRLSEGRYPVLVYFHGGGFALGAKDDEDLEPMLCALERGYAVVSAEYRKSGAARFPAALYDAKAAIRFLRANAERYQLDAGRIGAWGPSSGGWIVSMLGTTAGNPAFEDFSMGNGAYSSAVDAVLDWCGPCADFSRMDEMTLKAGLPLWRSHSDERSPESAFMGAALTEIPQLCRLAAPIYYAHPQIPPFLIVHGTADEAVPAEQSVAFANALRAAAGEARVELYLAEGKPHHGTAWYTERWLIDMCLDFFDRALKRQADFHEEEEKARETQQGVSPIF